METAVIFDIDDTLLDNYSAFSKAVVDVYNERSFSSEALKQLYMSFRQNSEKVYQQFRADVMKDPMKKFERWEIVPQRLGEDSTPKQLQELDDRYHDYQSNLRLADSFIELFGELKARQIQLGVLSNGLKKTQERKIAQLGIRNYIDEDHLFVSETLGESKPSIRCYEKVQALLPASIERFFYLGDSYINDILASKNAGWTPIWLNRFNEQSTVEGIIEVSSIEEAIVQVKRIAIG